ncbi:MAG: acyltransferase [Bacteroidales bacterium]|nr:MAG: acyltransferase [Bacteroidales bacterium]
MNNQFDDIRPYYDSEIQAVLKKLASTPGLINSLEAIVPHELTNDFIDNCYQINSIDEFQHKYMFPLLQHLLDKKKSVVTYSNQQYISSSSLFISNHRDIILDPTFLQYVLITNSHKTSEIAIGNNLAASEWILAAMRINKSFIVKRNISKGEQVSAFVKLSNYINYTIKDKKQSLWIAHREGRAKDGNDHTQPSLLKMFSLAGKGSFIENIKSLNICPLSISYEYDACDYLKAKEMQQKRDNPDFKKRQIDDVISMQTGVMGYASEIHYAFTPCINDRLDELATMRLPRNQEVQAVASIIDKQIHNAYKLYKSNYIAFDMLFDGDRFCKFYNSKEKRIFAQYISQQIEKIDLENTDIDFCREKILEMYANPLQNKLLAGQKTE